VGYLEKPPKWPSRLADYLGPARWLTHFGPRHLFLLLTNENTTRMKNYVGSRIDSDSRER